ncbi:ATP synthase F0 subunit A, partial [Candidatus Parcubacteria bacterium]
KRKLALIPTALQNLTEVLIETILTTMESVLGSRKLAERYLPLIATIFFSVLFSNWVGLLPGMGTILIQHGEEVVPLFRAPSSDLNFTLAVAIVSVVATNLFAILSLGAKSHLGKFFNFKSPVGFFIGILEFVSEVAKIVSFSFRLFGNIFAGEVLLVIVAFLIPYLAPLPFLLLEIFVGFIQAFVFAMLSLVFIAIATADHSSHTA